MTASSSSMHIVFLDLSPCSDPLSINSVGIHSHTLFFSWDQLWDTVGRVVSSTAHMPQLSRVSVVFTTTKTYTERAVSARSQES